MKPITAAEWESLASRLYSQIGEFATVTEDSISIVEAQVPEELRPLANRICQELFAWGPIENLLTDREVTEVLINAYDEVWIERNGILEKFSDCFFSPQSFDRFIHRLETETGQHLTFENPTLMGSTRGFRIQLIGDEICKNSAIVSIRRLAKNEWSLKKLVDSGWADQVALDILQNEVRAHRNVLVVGNTGSGKTSVINSLLALIPERERCVVLEDTDEIALPNRVSVKLKTRQDPARSGIEINYEELLRATLRIRPDRIVLGEIRGREARDFLLALSTGHRGSLATMHAETALEALTRLEMLIAMAAHEWSSSSIQRLLQFGVDTIVVVHRSASTGHRRLSHIARVSSLEISGFTLETLWQAEQLDWPPSQPVLEPLSSLSSLKWG